MSEERKRIITVEQFRELARPTSIHLDESEVDIYIRESEDASIMHLTWSLPRCCATSITSVFPSFSTVRPSLISGIVSESN